MKVEFNLIAIHILPGCAKHIRKILNEDEWFFFNKKYKEKNGEILINNSYSIPVNFYSNKINIQAIVGKNGSGKSSVIEILLRLINNLAYELISNTDLDNELHFVLDIQAELFFETGGNINSLKCIENKVYLDQGDGNYIVVDKYVAINKDLSKYNLGGPNSLSAAIPLLQKFFFTIVNNYSFHAYNAYDFLEEYENRENVWLNGLFHKNDGYLTPLVLNPFRDLGKIDMEREKNLTNNRLASLFYRFKKEGINFIPDYEFQFLTFNINLNHVKNKYQYYQQKKGVRSLKKREKVVAAQNNKPDIFNTTLKYYFGTIKEDARIEQAYKYLVYKTYSISAKYPNYSKFVKIDLDQFNSYCHASERPKIKDLVDKIKSDPSHTTLKIRQTLKFIDYITNHSDDQYLKTLGEDYIEYMPKDDSIFIGLTNFDILIASFPPPFYKVSIYLKSLNGELNISD